MMLCHLLQALDCTLVRGRADLAVEAVCCDSRAVTPGCVFVCLPGQHTDGRRFAPAAAAAGAAVLVYEDALPDPPPGPALVRVEPGKARRVLAQMAVRLCGFPARRMTMVGITGTKGKTTAAHLLAAMLTAAGRRVGCVGTNGAAWPGQRHDLGCTTPESCDLQRLLRAMADDGCDTCVMEVSSLGLKMDRVGGIEFDVGVFTNLSPDHIGMGEHASYAEYRAWKSVLFRRCRVGVVNADDPWTGRLLKDAACQTFSYAEKSAADLRAEEICLEADHVAFTAVTKQERVPVRVNIPGGFMVYNTLDVLGAALVLGVSLERAAAILAKVPHVKGRVEVVPTPGKDYTVLIDYAHSPDGMVNVLTSVKGFAKGRTIALFGCGGDRDKTKRPKMGRVAAEIADFVVVTTDNPRTEKPADIIADILPGLEGSDTPYVVVEDRIEAIHWAMDHAQPGDVIVLCGKGHETYQEINHVKHHMDEREIVADYLAGK